MKLTLTSFFSGFGKQIGFTCSVIFAFVCGVIVTTDRDSRREEVEQKSIEEPVWPRFTEARAEPEDFFPAAEFRQQSGILLGCYEQLNTNPQLYVDIARAVDRRLPLFGLVYTEAEARKGEALIRESGLPEDAMHFLPLPANTIWIRDYAPFMVRYSDNSVGMVDAKYQSRKSKELRRRDEEMAATLAGLLGLPVRSIPLVLEGGNFLSNGDGAILTTSRMIQVNNEFEFSEKIVGDLLNDYFGVRRWSYAVPLEGEPTGHVDMFVSVLGKNVIVVGEIDPLVDPENSKRLDDAAAHFARITTSLGPMKVFRIPMPPKWGEYWRSYTNVIMANGVLLMPSYSDVDPQLEDRAEEVYRALKPGWQIKRIPCDALVKEEGQLHCISYNIPRYVSLDRLYERIAERRKGAASFRKQTKVSSAIGKNPGEVLRSLFDRG